MIADKNFRMKKQFKYIVDLMGGTDVHKRGEFRRMFIQAQLSEEAARRQALKSKDTSIGGSNKRTHSKEGVAQD